MTITVFDSPDPAAVAAKATQLFAEGARAVILYLSPINPTGPKTVRKAHVDALHAAGIAVGFVCEGWGGSDNFAHGDINGPCGTRDGGFCGHYLKTLGAPDGVAVSPTVDNDTSPAQLNQLCVPYFRAFRAAMASNYKMGAYGCGALLFALEADAVDNGTSVNINQKSIMDIPWLSNAMGWSRSHEYAATGRAIITQQRQSALLGIDIDPDVVKGELAAAGFWMPGTAVQQQPAPEATPQATVEPIAGVPVRQLNIIATCFGGAGDREASAYDGMVDPTVPGVALPFHFSQSPRPKVRVILGDKVVICEIVDVGPHNTDDPYWIKGARPEAESQSGNKAGIDLTPAVFSGLGIGPHDPTFGLVTVSWEFAQ